MSKHHDDWLGPPFLQCKHPNYINLLWFFPQKQMDVPVALFARQCTDLCRCGRCCHPCPRHERVWPLRQLVASSMWLDHTVSRGISDILGRQCQLRMNVNPSAVELGAYHCNSISSALGAVPLLKKDDRVYRSPVIRKVISGLKSSRSALNCSSQSCICLEGSRAVNLTEGWPWFSRYLHVFTVFCAHA